MLFKFIIKYLIKARLTRGDLFIGSLCVAVCKIAQHSQRKVGGGLGGEVK